MEPGQDSATALVAVLQGGYVLARASGSADTYRQAVDGALGLLACHAGEECLVVITRRGALELSDAVIDLRAGDAATFQGSIPHRLRNTCRGRLTALSIITPPSF